ncbi:hypothetical protein PR048_021080 [Dryococelus australis]|uniref:Uncharacterized protein n=1 Tax=Dryococelus australis TaxID=614101 RepID=A0ABQ9GX83_9NEOP|nr:hypothetical protein PR048_021080 [Dryococelus australis]
MKDSTRREKEDGLARASGVARRGRHRCDQQYLEEEVEDCWADDNGRTLQSCWRRLKRWNACGAGGPPGRCWQLLKRLRASGRWLVLRNWQGHQWPLAPPKSQAWYECISVAETVVRPLTSRLDEPGSFPGGVTSRFFNMGIVPDDAARRLVFSGISCFLHTYIPAVLHTHLSTPSSALKSRC